MFIVHSVCLDLARKSLAKCGGKGEKGGLTINGSIVSQGTGVHVRGVRYIVQHKWETVLDVSLFYQLHKTYYI